MTPATANTIQRASEPPDGTLQHGVMVIRNVTRNTRLADNVEVAGSGYKRSKGLLGRKELEAGAGLWIDRKSTRLNSSH